MKIHSELNKKDHDIVETIIEEFELYKEQSSSNRITWGECYDAYCSIAEQSKNPYMANVYLPKAHEATELLTSFLIGSSQIVRAKPADKDDSKKADPIQKLLQYQWQKVLRANEKTETWVKQGILFGTGVMKVGWIDEEDKQLDDPFIETVELPRFYADYFTKDLQDQHSVIQEIISTEDKVKNNVAYKDSKNLKFIEAPEITNITERTFAGADSISEIKSKNVVKKVRLLERWTYKEVITLAETQNGWVVLRREDNPYNFLPFVIFRYKNSPLANRFYGIGAIEPTLIIGKAMNSAMNQMFDNITLINQKMFLKRRGASINPNDLVARPGGIIEVTDINQDIKALEVSDIKASISMLLNVLDSEFQQASGAVNLLKGFPGAEFATEVAIQQKNVTTLLDRVTNHFHIALSELGQMLVDVNLENITTNKTIKLMETDNEDIWLEVSPDEINGKFDIDVQVDRTAQTDRIIMAKQFIDFLSVAAKNPDVSQQIDWMPIMRKWLEFQGFADTDMFFKKSQMPQGNMAELRGASPGQRAALRTNEAPKRGEELSTQGLNQSAVSPIISK